MICQRVAAERMFESGCQWSPQMLMATMQNEMPRELPGPECDISDTKKIPTTSGVYFAWACEGEKWSCVYVGESVNMRGRLSNRKELRGTKIGWFCCSREERKRIESWYIAILNPRLNCQSVVRADPSKTAAHFGEEVLQATIANGWHGRDKSAHVATVAKATYLSVKSVRSAWKSLQSKGVLKVKGDYAFLYSFYPEHYRDKGFSNPMRVPNEQD